MVAVAAMAHAAMNPVAMHALKDVMTAVALAAPALLKAVKMAVVAAVAVAAEVAVVTVRHRVSVIVSTLKASL